MKDLTKERITEIVDGASDMYEAMLNLYKEVLDMDWDKIETIRPTGIQCNVVTSTSIMDLMITKFCNPDETWPVLSLFLNKGFSGGHNELPDWKVYVEENCYDLKTIE